MSEEFIYLRSRSIAEGFLKSQTNAYLQKHRIRDFGCESEIKGKGIRRTRAREKWFGTYTVSVGMTPTAPSLRRLTIGSNFHVSAPDGSTSTYTNSPSWNHISNSLRRRRRSEQTKQRHVSISNLAEPWSRVLEALGASLRGHGQDLKTTTPLRRR